MKILIAVMTCYPYRQRAEAVRSTWAAEVQADKADLRFFVGAGDEPIPTDTVRLDCADDYRSFPLKVQAMRRWALAHDYDLVFKCDDDVYLRPERLLATLPRADYVGRVRGPSGDYPAPYCSGFGYWLSRRALEIMAAAQWNGDTAEDRFTATALMAEGIFGTHDHRYVVVRSNRNGISGTEAPLPGNDVIAACEFEPPVMTTVHQAFSTERSRWEGRGIKTGTLDRASVMIKTFLRDGYLFACLRGLEHNFPDMKIVIVDDGYESPVKIRKYADLRAMGHSCLWLPFDSGFGSKANASIAHCNREFVLIGSDDFDFLDRRVRPGIEKMLRVMDTNPDLGIVSGRVDGRPYEGFIEKGPGYIQEHRLDPANCETMADGTRFQRCDLTVNYSLVRRTLLDQVQWHAEFKIGGDHFLFFDEAKRAGWGIAWVEDANIYQMKFNPQWQEGNYARYRARAKDSLPRFFEMMGIERYIGFDGRVDTLAKGVTA